MCVYASVREYACVRVCGAAYGYAYVNVCLRNAQFFWNKYACVCVYASVREYACVRVYGAAYEYAYVNVRVP